MQSDREIIYNIKKKKGLSKEKLEELLFRWQKKLCMEEWKFDIKIVDFKRKNDYRQSGDFVADVENKKASILMTWDPWRNDEEYTLVHEMIHVMVYDFDKFSEDLILKHGTHSENEHELYMDKLESFVHHLTRLFVGRSDR